jgi:hypothetical protein
MQLANAIRILFEQADALPTEIDDRGRFRACLGEVQGCLLEIGAQPPRPYPLVTRSPRSTRNSSRMPVRLPSSVAQRLNDAVVRLA